MRRIQYIVNLFTQLKNVDLTFLYRTAFWLSVLGIFNFIYDFGFSQTKLEQQIIDAIYFLAIFLGLVSTLLRYLDKSKEIKRKILLFDFISISYTCYIVYMYVFVGEAFQTDLVLENPTWVVLAVLLTFIREFSEFRISFNRSYLNPAQLFILSFLVIIFLGALLLMLPNATNGGLSFIDAFFTSTSAVCVTGLAVVDTGTYFTTFGQTILLALIQIGGIGILTFASYFSYFFKGVTTFETQLSLREMTNANKLGEVFQTLKYILLITLTIELSSAFFIYLSLDDTAFNSIKEKMFFSIFHSVSAFCNAGFSTLSNSMYESSFRFNYSLQFIVAITFILGGLGFPIVVNILTYIKHKLMRFLFPKNKHLGHRPWILNINSRITLFTTILITLVAFIFFFILEYNHTLKEHSFGGKIVTALFGAATPRTAGFNSVDMTALAFPTVMLTFLLMWIGASPVSTGGGIKVSTFAIATLNILSLAKGKSRIEIFRREIADISVKRAFATISLSLIVIGFGIMLISIYDPEKGLLNIAFESFSAYSTVGLSLGITSSLSIPSKIVVIAIMFIGRVSMLSIIIALFKKVKHKNYRYPTEEITIN